MSLISTTDDDYTMPLSGEHIPASLRFLAKKEGVKMVHQDPDCTGGAGGTLRTSQRRKFVCGGLGEVQNICRRLLRMKCAVNTHAYGWVHLIVVPVPVRSQVIVVPVPDLTCCAHDALYSTAIWALQHC